MTEQFRGISDARDIVTVGAYERDNFGDLLFWHAARHYSGSRSVVPTAPFAGVSRELLGVDVQSYYATLKGQPNTPVWVVGGEVGGTVLSKAASSHPVSATMGVDQTVRDSSLPLHASPYMPREFAHPIVLNSVGLDGIRTLRGARLGYAVNSLRSASYISVRETASSETLRRLGIDHKLAPDAVHTLLNWYTPKPVVGDYVIFQMKGSLLAKEDHAQLAQALLTLLTAGESIVLFAAGLASGHDSVEQYEKLRDEIGRHSPDTTVILHLESDPFDKVDLIASCRLWVGTSLHGLIISNTLSVPNVSLAIRKLQIYSNTWGMAMPSNVPVSQLAAAASHARSASRVERTRAIAADLSSRADESIKHTVERADASRDEGTRGAVGLSKKASILASLRERARIMK